MVETAHDSQLPGQLALMRQFVERKLEPWPEFQACLVVGSVAHGEARADSDVDCVFLFDPLDERMVPAEFVWSPTTDTYSTIFEVDALAVGGVQIDAKRMSVAQFRSLAWEDGFKHELASAILLFDREAKIAPLLAERLRYPEPLRLERIREHYVEADRFSEEWRVQSWLRRGGPLCAHEQLTVALEEIIALLHAYNRTWLPWRYRRLISTLKLPWLPDGFAESVQSILCEVAPTEESVARRGRRTVDLLETVADQLRAEGLLTNVSDVFAATHTALGYAHNMEAWQQAHRELLIQRGSSVAPPEGEQEGDRACDRSARREAD